MSLYIAKETSLHRLHPLTKIFIMVFGFYSAIIFNSPLYILPLLIFFIFLTIICGGINNLIRMRFILILLFLFSSILWALFIKSGRTILKFGPITITDDSLTYGLGMGLRLDLMVITGLLFFSITMIEEFSLGLHKLGLPYPLCFAISMAFRLVPLFLKEAMIVTEAQTLRGLDLNSGGFFNRIKNHFPLIIPVFATTIKGMDNLFLALESKGFAPDKKRTFYLESHLKFIDYSILIVLILLAIFLLFLRIHHFGVVLNRL
jgi:energy-coupling factor transport system permease protein